MLKSGGKFLVLGLVAMLVLTGCQNISKEDLSSLKAKANKAEELALDNARLQKETEQLKEERQSLLKSEKELQTKLEQEIADNQVLIEQNAQTGSIKITMQQEILFPSGSFKIDQQNAEEVLKTIVASLDGENKLRIVGYTDNLPISPKWRGKFSDNWDLSARRAGEVARFLIWGAGFPAERIEIVGRASNNPIASNDSKEGRALNRRIEMIVEK